MSYYIEGHRIEPPYTRAMRLHDDAPLVIVKREDFTRYLDMGYKEIVKLPAHFGRDR